MLLLARLSFVANSPLNVFTFTLPCLSTVSRTRSGATFPVSSKNRRSMWLEFITALVNMTLKRVDLSPDKSCHSRTRHSSTRTNVQTSFHLRRVARFSPRILCVQRRGADAWHDKVLRAARCTHRIVSPRETFHQSSDLAALLQQFAFHSWFSMSFHSLWITSHSSTSTYT